MTKSTARGRLIDLTIGNIIGAWKGISEPFTTKRLELSPYLHEDELVGLREKIDSCLSAEGGEVSARARAAELGNAYLGLNDEGRLKFLSLLASEFGVDHDAVRKTSERLFADLSMQERLSVEQRLREKLKPAHLTLLTQFNALPQGIKFLVELRSDMLRYVKTNPEIAPLAEVLREQLSLWFDIGFLQLRQINWDAPASLLEKLIQYEAVHEIGSWDNLHHRLSDTRRCFAFFHPGMPDEPLIFVWVALVSELADNVDRLLDQNDHSEDSHQHASTAIFYSISSAQVGLSGVSLGNFLIKRVVDELRQELPTLSTFSTLSPIPGFSSWLQQQLDESSQTLLHDDEQQALTSLSEQSFAELLATGSWHNDEPLRDAMQAPMSRLAVSYITACREGGKRVIDSVANFHLCNGARVERINWNADSSERGRAQYYSVMVNYLYDLAEIDGNHEKYIQSGEVTLSKSVANLLR